MRHQPRTYYAHRRLLTDRVMECSYRIWEGRVVCLGLEANLYCLRRLRLPASWTDTSAKIMLLLWQLCLSTEGRRKPESCLASNDF